MCVQICSSDLLCQVALMRTLTESTCRYSVLQALDEETRTGDAEISEHRLLLSQALDVTLADDVPLNPVSGTAKSG